MDSAAALGCTAATVVVVSVSIAVDVAVAVSDVGGVFSADATRL